jgi:hypothetical protein
MWKKASKIVENVEKSRKSRLKRSSFDNRVLIAKTKINQLTRFLILE